MKLIYGIGKVKKNFKNAVLTIGVFDGVHRGHQALIKKAVEKAREINAQAVVMTFDPHPVHILRPETEKPLISSLSYRLRLIEKLGAVVCIVVHFTKRFSQLSPQKFIKRYLVDKIQLKEIFVGDDFRFGQNRSGTLEYFQEAGTKYGFVINALHPVGVTGSCQKKIGSTLIRQLIFEGKLSQAKKFLGRNVAVMGKVVKGDGRGKILGFPTANIYPQQEITPPIGVYAAYVTIIGKSGEHSWTRIETKGINSGSGEGSFFAMVNIGRRPSFKKLNKSINIEAHIFNFDKDIYGKEIIVEFVKKIRNEKNFISQEKLINQLRKDKISVLHHLK